MRCRACNSNLTDREASTKWNNYQEIKNTEDQYIGLCSDCQRGAGVTGLDNPFISDKPYEDHLEVIEQEDEDGTSRTD